MVTPEGKVVGEHVGLMFYTLGQRKGLGIGGAGEPWFVAAKDLTKNELIVVQGHDHPLLYTQSLIMNDLSFTLPERPKEGRYTCKTRYRMADAPCTLRYLDDENIELVFDEPQWAVTPDNLLYCTTAMCAWAAVSSCPPTSLSSLLLNTRAV